MKKTFVLIILDGWGIGKHEDSNPIYQANTPTIKYFQKYYPALALQSAGISVGLPWNEPGNSEVGHLTIGSGQIIYQHFPRITLAIQKGEFFKNPALNNAFDAVQKNKGTVHILGLLSSGNVHSSYEHLLALLKLASQKKPERVLLHLFTDGRDCPPQSGRDLVMRLTNDLEKIGIGQLASLSGRYYALDRSKNWQNTKKVYDLITKGIGRTEKDFNKIFDACYNRGLTDAYVEPTLIVDPEKSKDLPIIKNGDSLIFLDFREDSLRQLVQSLGQKNFSAFETQPLDIKITTMTDYDDSLKIPAAFPSQKIISCLASVLSEHNLKQLKIAETEKYYHLTFFFNGLSEKIFPNEFRILIPSKETPRPEDNPEMRAPEITERLIAAIQEQTYNFIIVNYANPDTLAHTGNYQATLKGIEIVDQQLAQVYQVAKNNNTTLIITADHGNAERLYNPTTGEKETEHDPNPVPFYLIDEKYRLAQERTPEQISQNERQTAGVLCDVAPTILELMGIPIPKEMNGKSLLKYFN